MKASVITMTRTYNYGATLQAYALQEYVTSMGHECTVVDHMNAGDKHRTLPLLDFSFGNLLMLPYKRRLERGFTRFEEFYREHMNMTAPYQNEQQLLDAPPAADVYISGSDQVWNPRDAKLDRFFLNFAPPTAKRISFAASIGVSQIPADKRERMQALLSGIDGISLREVGARDELSALTDKPISVNCDPVFLLEAEKWRAAESPVKGLVPGEYILCYLIYRPAWFSAWIRDMKKKTGKKIVVVGLQGFRRIFCDRYVRDAGPREFLWLIDNAAAVVTTSFHGSAFSLVFGKPFVAIPDPPRPARIRSLLHLFGLPQNELGENNPHFTFEEYDRNAVLAVAAKERERAREYLTRFLP